jgi:hypothetical protein
MIVGCGHDHLDPHRRGIDRRLRWHGVVAGGSLTSVVSVPAPSADVFGAAVRATDWALLFFAGRAQ